MVIIKANDEELDDELRSIDTTLCNLYIFENLKPEAIEPELVLLESFRNISLKPSSPRFIGSVLEYGSELIRLKTKPTEIEIDDLNDGDYESKTTPDMGGDGEPITATEIIGKTNPKSGINLLEDVDIVNLLCIPSINMDESPETDTSLTELFQIYSTALDLCKKKRSFLIVDPLVSGKIKMVQKIKRVRIIQNPRIKMQQYFFPEYNVQIKKMKTDLEIFHHVV